MQQLVYKNKLYITGTSKEVMTQLKELSQQFKTVKELLNFYMQPPEQTEYLN